MKRGFISDNCAGAHPSILAAIAGANLGHMPSYGADDCCQRGAASLCAALEKESPILFAMNGTGANILSLACAVKPFESILCADCAHILLDETGAPERVLGAKLQGIPTKDGKLTTQAIAPLLSALGNPHHSQPRVLSLTNVTEWGAVYTPKEIRTLSDFAHAHGLLVHLDGARIANAAVAEGATLADMTWKAGVDVMSFGGVKNGGMFGEAVIFFYAALAENAPYIRKNITQLQSKMRFIGAQFEALMAGDLWRQNAAHANGMAQRLEKMLLRFSPIEIVHPAKANIIFARMPKPWADTVCQAGYASELGGLLRLVCAFDTQEGDIDALEGLLSGLSAT